MRKKAVCINLEIYQHQFVRDRNINLSKAVQEMIQLLIDEEKTQL
jgi:post-segregation antitoxin (ccd killing protein)